MVGLEVARWQQRWALLIERLTLVSSKSRLESELLAALTQPAQPTILAFINAHAMNCAARDLAFTRSLLAADYVLRDGAGMHLLLRLMGKDPGLNLNGTDLIPQLLKRYAGRSIALFGTVEPHLSKAARQVQQLRVPAASVMTLADGFQDSKVYVDIAQRDRPALIVLGMGMPKQEFVSKILRSELDHPCLIICGGAIIDFMGGRVERAPIIFQALGMEWLYRLGKEPRRLFARYVLGNPLFISKALLLAFKRKLMIQ